MMPTGIAISRQGSKLRVTFENASRQVEVTASAARWATWAAQVADAAALAAGPGGHPAGPPERPGGQDAGGRPR
jgi:hypothetical protein